VGVVELLPQGGILGVELAELVLMVNEALFEEASVLVDGLAGATDLVCLSGDGSVTVGENSGSIADPGA